MTEADKENKICARICMEIRGSLDSPLLIGSGENEHTDLDILMTSDGTPFVPGSALAGALRSYLEANMGVGDAEDLFGTLGWGLRTEENRRIQKETQEYQSRIFVYDTLLKNANVTVRDGVRLDEYKTSEENAKYDMQVVENGVEFEVRLEILIRDREEKKNGDLETALKCDLSRLRCCVSGMETGNLRLGARSRRGFGKLKLNQVQYRIFRMNQVTDFETWLDWDWQAMSAFEGGSKWDLNKLGDISGEEHCMRIPLRIKDTILIRRYGTDPWGKSHKTGEVQEADYGQLTLLDGSAVIPGTTWAGAIRSYLAGLVKEFGQLDSWEEAQETLEPFFGTWVGHDEKKASRVIFDETKIKGGHRMPVVRNSIDRFTGGAAKGALFSEMLWAGGKAELEIRWSERELKETEHQVLCGLLLWAAYGLNNGLLAVGGETGVGRGIFQEEGTVRIDGSKIEDTQKYLRAAAGWCRRLKEE